MNKNKKIIERIEMLIGKGVLFVIEVIIVMLLFWLCLFILNLILETMTHNFWLTMFVVVLDIILLLREFNLYEKDIIEKNQKNFKKSVDK